MKSYTDIEQSKKLEEILPIESADMRYHTISKYNPYPCDEIVYTIYFGNPSGDDIPCWSLAALSKLMPFQIIKNNNRFGFYQVKGFNKQGETYRFGYKTNNDSFLFETSWYNDVIDAAFEMVVWLKENDKL